MSDSRKNILIVGAGEAGRMVAREIGAHPDTGLEVIGFLDDDVELHGCRFEHKPVLGPCERLVEIAGERAVDEVIISVPTGSRDFVRRIVSLCRDAEVAFKIVPGLIEIIRGPVHLEQIREVHPDDLLGRETVAFDEKEIAGFLDGRRVLVTGAGGSIGGEICRQLGRFSPGELLLYGRGENQIYHIEEEMRRDHPHLNVRSVIGDIRDRHGVKRAFERFRPQLVYHAAAHKHVHYMEAYPEEAVQNNVFGTANVIDACGAAGVDRLVMLSTDKAVRPAGVMGATKRLAEYLMTDAGDRFPNLRPMTVRFGNVLGSRGSVVPLFVRQIRAGGPVTISDAAASRFFMTLKEACMLVVQASMMGRGGEIFILRMGAPIRISELAKDLIALHGLRPNVDIDLTITGLRPGEKLHEELIVDGERVDSSSHDYILVAHPGLPDQWDRDGALDRLRALVDSGNDAEIRTLLKGWISDAAL